MDFFRKSKMRVSWITPSAQRDPDKQLASVWIRSFQVFPYLGNKDFICSMNRYFPRPEVAVFLRRYSSGDVELASKLKRKGTRIILDVIVNYFEVYPPHPEGYGGCSREQHYNFMKLAELADEIWCASPFLKSVADRFHQNAVFISDSIDSCHFSQLKQYGSDNSRPLRFGWSGVSSKALPLNMFKHWIESGAIKMLIISDKRPDLDFPYEYRKWTYSNFPRDIVDCDLCVAPRDVENDYDRGHSLFKIGVFMAEGVPALASPVPSYELLLGKGKGGHLCRNYNEWCVLIDKSINEPGLLQKWSRESVEQIRPYFTENVSLEIARRLAMLRQ